MFKTITSILITLYTMAGYAQVNSATSYIEKVNKLLDKQKFEEAMVTISFAIKEMPDSMELYDMRGIMYEAFRLYDKAIADFTTALDKTDNPKQISHLLANRGGTKYKTRDFTGSYDDLLEAIQIDSGNIAALNNLAAVCDEVNRTNETLKYLNQIITVDSTYVPAYVNLGFKYQALDSHDKAITYFDKAVELTPDEPLAYSNRSFSKLKTNDLKGAMKDINRSIKLYPTNSYAYKIRALILIEKQKLKDACKDLKLASELGYTKQYGSEVNELQSKYCED